MTLKTRVLVERPISIPALWEHARKLIGASDDRWATYHDPATYGRPRYGTAIGQGLCGILVVEYGADGPIPRCDEHPDDCAAEGSRCCRPAEGSAIVSLDTGYGYDRGGVGADGLHAAFVDLLGVYLDEQRTRWWWQDEFTGTWHPSRNWLPEFAQVELRFARGVLAVERGEAQGLVQRARS